MKLDTTEDKSVCEVLVNIAGEVFPVLFDGRVASTPDFPNIPIEYISHCGIKITQAMMVSICKRKLGLI
jgi:hypothetical protein